MTASDDALDNTTQYWLDGNSRQTKVVDGLDKETGYFYDLAGRLTKVRKKLGEDNVDILG